MRGSQHRAGPGWWGPTIGPATTLLVAAVTEILSGTTLRVPNPPALLSLSLVFAGFTGGLSSGLLSAAIAWLYTAYFFSLPGQAFQYTDENLRRVIVWAIAMPATALMVGHLKRRAERAFEALGANVVLRAQLAERQRAEAALQASQAMFQALFESVPDAIVAVNREGRITRVNAQAETMFGYSRDELLGQVIERLIPEHMRDRHVEHRRGYLAQPRTRPMGTGLELTARRKDGSEFPVDINLGPLKGDGETMVVSTIRDITQRQQAEAALAAKNEDVKAMTQQLWQTAKLATMGELAANIAHELNNPLATVSLRVESLLAQVPEGDPKRRPLAIIEQEVERMGTLVANLLQFSRRSAPQISTVDVREELEKTVELIHYHLRQRNIAIVRQFATDAPLVRADRQQLRQLFLNLFMNASDAMPEGGTLTLRAGPADPGLPTAVVIEVTDTGVGIAPDDLPKVMEPFFTTKPVGKGTGLGLAICRRIVEVHGGTLDIASEGVLGRGATVRIVLPVSNGANAAQL